jgi:hypothetical protein
MPVASKEVIEAYFEANPAAEKFRDTPPTFLKVASQALGLIDKEDKKENKKKVDKASKLELALSSIKRSQLSLFLVKRPSPSRSSSSTPSRPSSLAMRKRAVKQAAKATKSNAKRQRGRRRVAEALEETVEKVTREMRATRELMARKSPQEKASQSLSTSSVT